ncbi:hypothetical protein WJX73_006256 [Symbiochloris irregularis]|uniref:Metallo-beta-lactamase domain-containing protein n=1 Tax=Symbiochloris irregularis TaxID=706552 RepID=A0AAW1NVH3_9CHLO
MMYSVVIIAVLSSLATSNAQQSAQATTVDPNYILPGFTAAPNDTIRIIALGTGTPNTLPKQVATSYLIQLGSQRNILFDVGTGSITNLYATGINMSTIDLVFLSHLHSDHVTDLGPLYALANGRTRPLTIYGPSGSAPQYGTAALVSGLKQFLAWDQQARNLVSEFPAGYQGNQVVAHEFNYTGVDQLIYDQDGIQVYSNPAFHYDTPGPVSIRLEWNNLTVTYSGDTIPLDTFVDFAKGSDVVIHESVGPIYNLSLESKATRNILTNHTSQAEVGAVFQAVQPRLAIATHLRITPYTITPILESIRSQYPSGPLALALDNSVWDITSKSIVQRQFVPLLEKAGYEFTGHPRTYDLYTSAVSTFQPRPNVVTGDLTVFEVPNAPPVSAAG